MNDSLKLFMPRLLLCLKEIPWWRFRRIPPLLRRLQLLNHHHPSRRPHRRQPRTPSLLLDNNIHMVLCWLVLGGMSCLNASACGAFMTCVLTFYSSLVFFRQELGSDSVPTLSSKYAYHCFFNDWLLYHFHVYIAADLLLASFLAAVCDSRLQNDRSHLCVVRPKSWNRASLCGLLQVRGGFRWPANHLILN